MSRHLILGPTLVLGLGLVTLCACADPDLPNAIAYVQQDQVEVLPLAFWANTAVLTPDRAAALQRLRGDLPAGGLFLAVAGGLAEARAQQVGAALNRVVVAVPQPLPPSPGGIDAALLSVATRRLVATACLTPGQPVPPGNWPGDDAARPRSMPPGCAAANALQQMAVSQEDLRHGRPLPPGAALPVARAIERYYSRSELAPPGPASASPGLGGGSLTPVAAPAPDAGADLLQGPLTQPAAATGPAPAAASPASPVP